MLFSDEIGLHLADGDGSAAVDLVRKAIWTHPSHPPAELQRIQHAKWDRTKASLIPPRGAREFQSAMITQRHAYVFAVLK